MPITSSIASWGEVYDCGSREAEEAEFLALAQELLKVQEINRQKSGGDAMRTFHAKMVVGVTNAQLVIDRDLPIRYKAGHFVPGAKLPATVRLSNASGVPQADSQPDMRGMAVRLVLEAGVHHDLLMTNYPVSHARNVQQFVAFAVLASQDRAVMVEKLISQFGKEEANRMLGNIQRGVRPSSSLAQECFWSRGAVLWASAGPVRFNMKPAEGTGIGPTDIATSVDSLKDEFQNRLRSLDVCYRLSVQPFVSEENTPIEDGAVEWTEQVSPSIGIATLVIPRQVLGATYPSTSVDDIAFNPWNAPADFRPLGNLNRARRVIYAASAKGWLGR